MDNKDLSQQLQNIAHLYANEIQNFDLAVKKIDQEDLRDELREVLDEHKDHFKEMSDYTRQFGGQPPRLGKTSDFVQGINPVTDEMNTQQILRTLHSNENFLTQNLQQFMEKADIPELAHDIEEDIDDEQIYMKTLSDFIE